MKRLLILFTCLITSIAVWSQDNKALANEKAKKAVEMMDTGSPDEAIAMLEEAKKLDPGTYVYDYEIGYALFLKKDYAGALEVYKKTVRYKDKNDQCYQMLGNAWDYVGEPDKAIKAYDQGLKLFPTSGRLYLEKGTVYNIQKKFGEALLNYEKGILVDPSYPSNYYRATQLLCNSDEEVWGMIYGEIFLNLEPNTARTGEISKMLFDTYKSQVKFISDSSFSVSFSKQTVINLSVKDIKNLQSFKLPYGSSFYEPTLILSLVGEKTIDLASLNRIRGRFVDNYMLRDNNIKYPNVLFDYQKKIKDAGHFEAYNYWLLGGGDEKEFSEWQSANEEKWDQFVDWYNSNRLVLNADTMFNRFKY
ncbi:MAG: tetratricopeptide repeat protein [Bacteroidales bacterium]